MPAARPDRGAAFQGTRPPGPPRAPRPARSRNAASAAPGEPAGDSPFTPSVAGTENAPGLNSASGNAAPLGTGQAPPFIRAPDRRPDMRPLGKPVISSRLTRFPGRRGRARTAAAPHGSPPAPGQQRETGWRPPQATASRPADGAGGQSDGGASPRSGRDRSAGGGTLRYRRDGRRRRVPGRGLDQCLTGAVPPAATARSSAPAKAASSARRSRPEPGGDKSAEPRPPGTRLWSVQSPGQMAGTSGGRRGHLHGG